MTATRSSSPQIATQRQPKYRNSFQHKGLERITLVGNAATTKKLRDLSGDHNESMARVLELGALLARREFSGTASQ